MEKWPKNGEKTHGIQNLKIFTIVEGEFQGIPASWGAKTQLNAIMALRKI